MRTLVALLLLGVPTAIAAPVPKELRRQSVAGTKPGDTAGGIKFAIDPKTQPKSFDWICPWGEWYGVCELKDDTFTIYIKGHGKNGGEKVRPAQLNIGPGIEMYSFQRSTAVK